MYINFKNVDFHNFNVVIEIIRGLASEGPPQLVVDHGHGYGFNICFKCRPERYKNSKILWDSSKE